MPQCASGYSLARSLLAVAGHGDASPAGRQKHFADSIVKVRRLYHVRFKETQHTKKADV